MNLSQELTDRGFIHQFSTPTLEEIVDGGKRTIYHGIDPSADSAHVGNLVIWMLLRHLATAGHKIVFLVGGATGMIGDPKPDAERQLKHFEEIDNNVQKIKVQAEKFFNDIEIEFVNNYDWFKDLPLLDFLRDIGKHYTVNELIKKDAIATRLQSDNGLSYTEFAYPLIQGFDFLQLFQTKNCTVQVGGSDQWGNMLSGVELVRRKLQKEVMVITSPLVIDKTTGKKFGKSENNAVWLEAEKTSPYRFYQFWLNVSDENVVDYLKLFTFSSLKEIDDIKQEFELNPGSRCAQKKLAFLVTEIIHGTEKTELVSRVSGVLFGTTLVSEMTDSGIEVLLQNAPTSVVSDGQPLIDILVESKLATSKREARTFIESGAVSLNGEKIESIECLLKESDQVNNISILRRGKKELCVLVTR